MNRQVTANQFSVSFEREGYRGQESFTGSMTTATFGAAAGDDVVVNEGFGGCGS